MFGNKVSKDGLIYKMCQYTFAIFNEFTPAKVAKNRCGFFLQGVVSGVVALGVVPLGVVMYLSVLAEVIGATTGSLVWIAGTLPYLVGLLPLFIMGCLLLVSVVCVAFLIIYSGVILFISTVCVILTGKINPYDFSGFNNNTLNFKDLHPFWYPTRDFIKNKWESLVAFKDKHCKEVDYE